jgi:hypothetical protein
LKIPFISSSRGIFILSLQEKRKGVLTRVQSLDLLISLADALPNELLKQKHHQKFSNLISSGTELWILVLKKKNRKSFISISLCFSQTGRAFFHKYPDLYQFLLSELEAATQNLGYVRKTFSCYM